MSKPEQPAPGVPLLPEAFVDNPQAAADPYPVYRRLRERGSVLREAFGVRVVDAALAHQVLRDPTRFRAAGAEQLGGRPLIPLHIDPPDHARYRRLLDPLFAAPAVAALAPRLAELADQLIDRFAARGRCEAMAEYARLLPAAVILELLGLPQADLPQLVAGKDAIIHPQGPDPAAQRAGQVAAGRALYEYLGRTLAERQRQPGQDLLSRLVAAEADGQRLSGQEILDILFMLILAGTDTVANAVGCALVWLAEHPDQRRRLVTDPAALEDTSVTEELLRWISPTALVARRAADDVELGGCAIKKDELVSVVLGSANTDPHAFADADQVDFGRARPIRHLAFGAGIHRCLGAHLARAELRVALRCWHRRIPDYALAANTRLAYDWPLRTLEQLPLVFPSS